MEHIKLVMKWFLVSFVSVKGVLIGLDVKVKVKTPLNSASLELSASLKCKVCI